MHLCFLLGFQHACLKRNNLKNNAFIFFFWKRHVIHENVEMLFSINCSDKTCLEYWLLLSKKITTTTTLCLINRFSPMHSTSTSMMHHGNSTFTRALGTSVARDTHAQDAARFYAMCARESVVCTRLDHACIMKHRCNGVHSFGTIEARDLHVQKETIFYAVCTCIKLSFQLGLCFYVI